MIYSTSDHGFAAKRDEGDGINRDLISSWSASNVEGSRIQGAIYHAMSRGDRREPIFRADRDRTRFVETLAEACCKTAWQVHAHCLMSNHFHLAIEPPHGNLVAGMKMVSGHLHQPICV